MYLYFNVIKTAQRKHRKLFCLPVKALTSKEDRAQILCLRLNSMV